MVKMWASTMRSSVYACVLRRANITGTWKRGIAEMLKEKKKHRVEKRREAVLRPLVYVTPVTHFHDWTAKQLTGKWGKKRKEIR